MAVLPTALSSGRQFAQVSPGTASASVYTAPSNNSNVTSPSATAYIKEIIVANPTSSAVNVSVSLGGGGTSNYLLPSVPVNPNDSKVISGLNTMIPAGQSIYVSASASGSVAVTISGVEIQ